MTEAEFDAYWEKRESLSEKDWFACEDSRPLLSFISKNLSERKLRLIDIAACRSIWSTLWEPIQKEIEVLERFIDDLDSEDAEEEYLDVRVGWFDPGDHAVKAAESGEGKTQAALLRDIVGNPFDLSPQTRCVIPLMLSTSPAPSTMSAPSTAYPSSPTR